MSAEADRRAADSGFWFTGLLLGAILLVATVVQLPVSLAPQWLTQRASAFLSVWPATWKFFDDGDSIGVPEAYQGDIADGRVVQLQISTMSATNAFGLGRADMALRIELDALKLAVPAGAWHFCDSDLDTCLASARPLRSVPVDNPVVSPMICGPTLLTVEYGRLAGPGAPRVTDRTVRRLVEVDVRCQ